MASNKLYLSRTNSFLLSWNFGSTKQILNEVVCSKFKRQRSLIHLLPGLTSCTANGERANVGRHTNLLIIIHLQTSGESFPPSTRVTVDGTVSHKESKRTSRAGSHVLQLQKQTQSEGVGGSVAWWACDKMSPAFGGSASDRQICERSKLARMCDPGDRIMAAKGFNVQDLLRVEWRR